MDFEKISNNDEIVLPLVGNPCSCACNKPASDPNSASSDKVKSNLTKSSGGCCPQT